MVNIPVEVKQPSQTSQQDIKKALNLNRVFSGADANPRPKKRSSLWLIAIIVLLIVALGLGAKIWLDSQKNFSQYQTLIGPETKTAVIFKIDRLESIAGLAMVELKKDPGFYPWLKEQISDFLAGAQVSLQKDVIPAFDDEAFFLVLPASPASPNRGEPSASERLSRDGSQGGPSDKNEFVWVAGAKIRAGQDFSAQKVTDKIEAGLRKNFGANELLYRQTKIKSAYSFSQINKPYYWGQIGSFILVSNDLQAMQGIIDRVIDK